MKNILFFICTYILSAAVFLSPAIAGPEKRFEPSSLKLRVITLENLQSGYKTFRTVCKSCHYRGNDRHAGFLHTESKSMRAWTRVFLTKYPKCARDGYWDSLDKDDLLNLNDYLYSNARDARDTSCFV